MLVLYILRVLGNKNFFDDRVTPHTRSPSRLGSLSRQVHLTWAVKFHDGVCAMLAPVYPHNSVYSKPPGNTN